MSKSLRILIVEDSEDDVILLVRYLTRNGFSPVYEVVETRERMKVALEKQEWDIVISDYSMPEFDGLGALEVLKESGLDLPFLIVSGQIGEEVAVSAMKAGAHDYIMKDNLARLSPAIERELQEAKERLERRVAEEALEKSEERYRSLYTKTPVMLHSVDATGKVISVSDYWLENLGYELEEVIGRPSTEFLTDASRQHAEKNCFPDFFKTGSIKEEDLQFVKKNGEVIDVLLSAIAERDAQNEIKRSMVVLVDVTERKKAEAAVRRLKDKLEAENIYLQEEIKLEHNFDEIIGSSESFSRVLSNVEIVAKTDATVLILGETGTGKELIARALHKLSPRKERALVKVNCAALPEELIESELFGHEKGAFTGAESAKAGRFELADRGTIFLDEIGDLPLDQQAKILRVLQEGEFERIGGTRTIKLDVRVIAATNIDLEKAVKADEFREDLFYRLNVFPIQLPPLRKRQTDIPLLVKHFANKYSRKFGKEITNVPRSVMNQLQSYGFRGNIRELENIIERAVILAPDNTLRLGENLTPIGNDIAESVEKEYTLEQVERKYITNVLNETDWRIEGETGAANQLGLKPSTLRSRMQKLGIKRDHIQ